MEAPPLARQRNGTHKLRGFGPRDGQFIESNGGSRGCKCGFNCGHQRGRGARHLDPGHEPRSQISFEAAYSPALAHISRAIEAHEQLNFYARLVRVRPPPWLLRPLTRKNSIRVGKIRPNCSCPSARGGQDRGSSSGTGPNTPTWRGEPFERESGHGAKQREGTRRGGTTQAKLHQPTELDCTFKLTPARNESKFSLN